VLERRASICEITAARAACGGADLLPWA